MSPLAEESTDLKPLKSSIQIAVENGRQVTATKAGTIPVTLENGDRIKTYNVLLVPGMDRRLLPVSALVSREFEVNYEGQ